MRVNIDEIKEGGLTRSWDLPREIVDEIVREEPAGYRAKAPAHVEARLAKSGRRVLVRAKGTATVGAPCGRCLQAVEVAVPLAFELTYVPEDELGDGGGEGEDRGKGEVAASFGPALAEEEPYAGKEIDLDPVTREQLILALPGYPVCQEGCKGLCSVCGGNLNERECGCERKVPDPRWAGLEKFKK